MWHKMCYPIVCGPEAAGGAKRYMPTHIVLPDWVPVEWVERVRRRYRVPVDTYGCNTLRPDLQKAERAARAELDGVTTEDLFRQSA